MIRPELGGKVHYVKGKTGSGYQYVSNANFSLPTAAWAGGANMGFGNSGKDAVVGAGNTNFNTSVYKTFTFGEHAGFEMRAESFNTFNHTQFNSLSDTNFQDKTFGYVGGDLAPRQFELGGKFTF